MAAISNDMIVRKMPWQSNMTELNHLGAAMRIKPQVFGSKIDQMFSAKVYSENNFTAKLIGTGREKLAESNEWTWTLKGARVRPLVVMEFIGDPSLTKKGQYSTPITVKYDGDDWKPGDIISPGKPSIQARVQSKSPGLQGGGYIYTIVLHGARNPNAFFEDKYLKNGAKWNKLFSQYEEGANQAGSVTFAEELELKQRLSRYRKEYEITADAQNHVLASKIMGPDGKMHSFWLDYAEAEYWKQWYAELEYGIWYSRTDNKTKGSTGRSVLSGAGIQQIMEKSHQETYTTLSGKLIREFIMDIVYARNKPGEKRDFVVATGEYGMVQFSEVVAAELKATGLILSEDTLVKSVSSTYHKNALAFGAQYVEYRMYNGATMTLMHNPLYDNIEVNTEIDDVTGRPKESMRYTFLDLSGEGADSNITLVKRKNAYKLVYVGGMVGPYGPRVGEMAAHDGDYYKMTVQDQRGVHIHDHTRCGELILGR